MPLRNHPPRVCLRRLVLLFVAAAALRVAWVGVRYARDDAWARLEYPDEEAYVMSARSLAGGHGLIDEFGYRATYMPAYPAFLSLFVSREQGLLWARLAQAILAALVAPGTCLLAHAVMARRQPAVAAADLQDSAPHSLAPAPGRVQAVASRDWLAPPFVAGVLAAVDPFLVFFSGLLLTEAVFAAVLVVAWWLVLRTARNGDRPGWGKTIAAGGMLCLGVLLRPAAMTLACTTAILLILVCRFEKRAVLRATLMLLVVFAGLTPWALRNARVVGEWRWLTTRGGISLYDGVRAGATGESDLAHTKALPEAMGLPETGWDAYFQGVAWAEIRRDPARIARLAGGKLLRTWSLRPNVAAYHGGTSGLISAGWMSFLLLGALIGTWRLRRDAAGWLLLVWPLLMTTGMHMIFVASVRYRVPVMPMLMVLAAIGWVPARRSGRTSDSVT